jgi:hypothetical protein
MERKKAEWSAKGMQGLCAAAAAADDFIHHPSI